MGAYFSIASFVYLIIFMYFFFSKGSVNNVETRVYKLFLITTFLGIFIDIMGYILYANGCDPYSLLYKIVAKSALLYFIAWSFEFSYYIYVISCKNASEEKRLTIFKRILFGIFYLIGIIILILPIGFQIKGNVIYPSGLSVNLTYLIFAIPIILSTIWSFIRMKRIITKKYTPLYLFIVMIIVMFIVQNIFPDLFLVNFVLSLVVVIMYFTIENPDVKMIEKLNLAKDTAEKANHAKSDFLSSMSHEIRTPLNAIVGFSECIKQANTLEEAKENATDIVSASTTLLEIVNGILDISKIESGKLELVQTDYESKKLFKEIEKLIIARLGDKQLDFKVSIAEDIPNVLYGDHFNIKKILINLLTNAVKYTDQGFVSFQVRCVRVNEEYCRLIISVKDSGRGIKQEDINKLFTKFQRLDEDRNTTVEGTGLGLAITKQLVDMMNGKIVVNSIYGEGSEFVVAIDQKISDKEIIFEENEDNITLDLTNKKILIVDDNKLNLKVATKLLKNYNLIIELCDNGYECLEKIKQGKTYDLILLDDMMPKMRGTETLLKLKEIENFQIPVIALTANAINGMKEYYKKYGFNDYLSKPIVKEELYLLLKKYLNNPSKTIENKLNNYSNKKILIVDDNKLNIKIAKRVMEPYQFQIDEVYSGKDCLLKTNETNYDLIFMDIMMPEMDGVETMLKLKENGFNGKIVALTADAVVGAKEKYLNDGFDDYISKPINKNLLDEVIKKIFENQ